MFVDRGWTCRKTALPLPGEMRIDNQASFKGSCSGRVFKVTGVAPIVQLKIPDHNLVNVTRALVERQYFVRDRDSGFVRPADCGSTALEPLGRYLRQLTAHGATLMPLGDDALLSRTPSSKKSVYRRALASLKERPVEKRDASIKMFVKRENTNLSKKPDSVPRAICPRDFRYLAELNRFIKPIEKQIYRNIDFMWGRRVVAKGLNAVERAEVIVSKWESFRRPVVVGADATRFDQHVSRSWLKWEHDVYKHFFTGSERGKLGMLLKWQLVNKVTSITAEGRVKCTIDGHRMSGDPNTSLGNTLIMSTMCKSYVDTKGFRVDYLNDGDDCLFFMEQDNLAEFMSGGYEFFLNFGFRIEFEPPVYVVEQVEFCQSKPVFTHSGWIMARNPHVHRSRDVSNFKPTNREEVRQWLTAIAEGGMILAAGVPVSQAFYECIGHITPKPRRRKFALDPWGSLVYLTKGLGARSKRITHAARSSFDLAWGICPADQRRIERRYARVSFHEHIVPSEPPCVGW